MISNFEDLKEAIQTNKDKHYLDVFDACIEHDAYKLKEKDPGDLIKEVEGGLWSDFLNLDQKVSVGFALEITSKHGTHQELDMSSSLNHGEAKSINGLHLVNARLHIQDMLDKAFCDLVSSCCSEINDIETYDEEEFREVNDRIDSKSLGSDQGPPYRDLIMSDDPAILHDYIFAVLWEDWAPDVLFEYFDKHGGLGEAYRTADKAVFHLYGRLCYGVAKKLSKIRDTLIMDDVFRIYLFAKFGQHQDFSMLHLGVELPDGYSPPTISEILAENANLHIEDIFKEVGRKMAWILVYKAVEEIKDMKNI